LPTALLSFWQWSASDVIGNTARGCLAEYIVAMALGQANGVRNDWREYDLSFGRWKIEVKASAYLQSWFQKRLSKPVFSIRPARKWDPELGEFVGESRRHADLYVFCLLDHTVKETLNPLDLSQWSFYILPTDRLTLNERYKNAKTIGLRSLFSLKPSIVQFGTLGKGIADVASQLMTAEPGPSAKSAQ
jgi:hypothetical protein